MGKMTKQEVLNILKSQNKGAQVTEGALRMYADVFIDYIEAQKNIDENGAMVAHPKTGAPIENPYLKIRAQAFAVLSKTRLKTDALWSSADVQ